MTHNTSLLSVLYTNAGIAIVLTELLDWARTLTGERDSQPPPYEAITV